MKDIVRTAVACTLAGVLGFAGASAAIAEENDVSADLEVRVRATTSSPQPFIRLREEARERIEELRENMREQRIDIRVELQDATTSDERRTIIEEMREDRDETRTQREEVRGAVKLRIKALLKTHVGAIYKRSENALSMFDNLVDRMESRIAKLQKAGVETGVVEDSLRASVQLVVAAKTDLGELEAVIDSVQDTSDAEDVRIQLRAAVSDLTESVKAAHASLLETSRLLASVSAEAEADAGADD